MPMRGTLGIGRVTSHDPKNFFVFFISSEVTGASNIPVCASPSSCFYGMPAVGTYIVYLEGENKIKRYLAQLNDDPDAWYGGSYDGTPLSDPNANQGNLLYMDVGDVFVGKHGRAYFNGDAFIHSEFFRSKIFLRDEGDAELKAYGFKLNTEDGGISVFTDASVPEDEDTDENTDEDTDEDTDADKDKNAGPNFGDSLTIQRVADTGTTAMRFDHTGSVSLSIVDGISAAHFDINGDISINCGTDGAEKPAPLAYIHLTNEVKAKNEEDTVPSSIRAFSGTFSAAFNKTATLSCESLSLTSSKGTDLSADDFTLTTKQSATLTVHAGLTIGADSSINITAPQVAINNGEALAYKRAFDALASKVEEIRKLLLSHTHPIPLYTYAGAGVLTAIPNGDASKVTTGSVSPASLGVTGTAKLVAG